MNEPRDTPRGRRMPRTLSAWLIFFSAIGLMILVADLTTHALRQISYFKQFLLAALWATGALGVWWLIRWSCDRRNFGRLLAGSAVFATLAACFYLEEDWRGKRAWEQCKAGLEASGLVMDWNQYLPPPIPDDQNFFTASTNIMMRFIKKSLTDAASDQLAQNPWLRISYGPNAFPIFTTTKTNPLLVANIVVVLPSAAGSYGRNTNDLVMNFNDPGAPAAIRDLIQKIVGRSAEGFAGFKFSEFPLSGLTPTRIWLQSDGQPSLAELGNLIPRDLATNLGQVQIEAAGTLGGFKVMLTDVHATAAADYLKWSDQFVPAFDDIRQALKRPYAIIPGDYTEFYRLPIPNFVLLRSLAQTLAQRAQCHLLLHQPDQALREVQLIHDVCRILEKPPTGKPKTLVEAMINVAISGLYVSTIAEGFRFHAWQEPQLLALEQQLQTVNLPPQVNESFRDELVGAAHLLETTTPQELNTLLSHGPSPGFWRKLYDPNLWLLNLTPRGWYYQNMAVAAALEQKAFVGFDCSNNLIQPGPARSGMLEVEGALRHWSPWNRWAAVAIPNFAIAMRTTAYNQTFANQARIACALERYLLVHGEYPDTLEALAPQLIEQLPHDLIGGQPLHYRRTDKQPAQSSGAAHGKFLLYSVGWNETDDGGTVAITKNGIEQPELGDWVWR